MSEHVLGNVFIFVYLGVLIQGNGDWRETPVTRMAIARRTFNQLYPFWIDGTLSHKLKLYLYEARKPCGLPGAVQSQVLAKVASVPSPAASLGRYRVGSSP